MAKRIISTPKAPAAVGPYNQAVITNGLMFCSGQIGFDPESMKFVSDEVEGQTEQCLKNMLAVLEAGGAGIEDVVKTTVFVADMGDFAKVNAIYEKYFSDTKPARSCVAAKTLPKNALVEIECIAALPSGK